MNNIQKGSRLHGVYSELTQISEYILRVSQGQIQTIAFAIMTKLNHNYKPSNFLKKSPKNT